MVNKRLSKKEYYTHESVRVMLFVIVLWFLAQILPSEYRQIYNELIIILALAQLITLAVDYLFLWKN